MKPCCSLFALAFFCAGILGARARNADWQAQVSRTPSGDFAPLPSLRMHFVFGWSNVLQAAEADATIMREGGEYRAVVTGKTEGLARALWPLDAQHTAVIAVKPLQPRRISQNEHYRNRTIQTLVRYDEKGIARLRKSSLDKEPSKWKRVDFSPIYDVIGGILYVRSLPLHVGDKIGVVCFPGDSPYLAIVTVEQRETIRCMGRERPALRLSLDIRRLEVSKKTPTAAVSYAKFRSGKVWVSDDDLRVPLRAEARIFVGFVYGEMTSLEKL